MVYFDWNAVEVNDRLYVSPSLMVIMTAAVAFNADSAILGVACLAGLGLLTPTDVRLRRWFQPAVNFGQFVVTATLTAVVITVVLGPDFLAAPLWRVALAGGLGAIAYGVTNVVLVGVIVRTVFGVRDTRPWSNMGVILLPMVGMGRYAVDTPDDRVASVHDERHLE